MPIRYKILICDDDADELLFFQESLHLLGVEYDLQWIPDGPGLLKYMASATTLPDFIFLDINMPGLSGLQCLSALHTSGLLNNTIVIMHSTSLREQDVEAAYVNGASSYLVKPFETVHLQKMLKKVLQLELNGARLERGDFCMIEPGMLQWPFVHFSRQDD